MSTPSLVNTIIGDYRIIDFLGAGGMGDVYRAAHLRIGHIVAIKFLNRAVGDPSFLERFLNEACIQAGLKHPNIATLHGFSEFRNSPYIIMEYVEGQTLDERVKLGGPLPPMEAIAIFKTVVTAVGYIHNCNIIHRDIKSTNVKITANGQVKLLDFGIAKAASTPQVTEIGSIIGTPPYLAPELFRDAKADVRTDVWALGVLFYEMVTGQMPFAGETLGCLVEKIGKGEYCRPSILNPTIPNQVETIIARCLNKHPNNRYQSAQDLIQDLERASPGKPTLPPTRLASAPVRWVAEKLRPRPTPVARQAVATPALPVPIARPARKRLLLWLGVMAPAVALSVALYMLNVVQVDPPITDQFTYVIDTLGGEHADVFINGVRVGRTPYKLLGKPGDQVDVILRCDGFKDVHELRTLPAKATRIPYSLKQSE